VYNFTYIVTLDVTLSAHFFCNSASDGYPIARK